MQVSTSKTRTFDKNFKQRPHQCKQQPENFNLLCMPIVIIFRIIRLYKITFKIQKW